MGSCTRSALALLLLSIVSACSEDGSDTSEAVQRAKLSEGCRINSDCSQEPTPLVCAFQRCHIQCRASHDCPPGLACRVADRPVNVCQLPDERKECVYNSDCPGQQVCAVDATCRDQCQTSRDCLADQVCSVGTCAEPGELVNGKLPRKSTVSTASDGQPCSYTSDCPEPQVCRDGRCAPECKTPRDCAPGQGCADGRCTPAGSGGASGAGGQGGGGAGASGSSGQSGQAGSGGTGGEAGQASAGSAGQASAGSAGQGGAGSGQAGEGGSAQGGAGSGGAAQACLYNSDCAAPLVCRPQGVCGFECVADVDCGGAEGCCSDHRCVACASGGAGGQGGGGQQGGAAGEGGQSGGGSGGALQACLYTSDCTPPQVCLAGFCRDQCKLDLDCPPGKTCQQGACKAPPGAPAGYGEPCNLTSDCTQTPGSPPLLCGAQGSCVYECQGDVDCDTLKGFCCVQNQCVTGVVCQGSAGSGGSAGTGGSGGSAGSEGTPCLDASACDDKVFCNGVERCYAGKCAPALLGPCDSQSACIEDICFEDSKTCGHKSLTDAGEDADKDGHLDFGCKGGDDCNDADPAVFTGAAETCDNKDNDCNGLVDDRSRGPSGLLGKGAGPCQTGGALPVGDNTLVLCGFTASGNTSSGLYTQVFGPDGSVVMGVYNIYDLGGYSSFLLRDAVSDGSTGAMVVADYYPMNAPPLRRGLLMVKPDGKLASVTQLTSTAQGSPDLVYTGSGYLLGLPVEQGGGVVGNVSLYSTEGALLGGPGLVPTADGKGSLGEAKRLRVGATKATLGAFYVDGSDGKVKVTIYGLSGSLLAGPVVLPAEAGSDVVALGGSKGGFVAVWVGASATWAAFVTNDGVVGPAMKIDGSRALNGQGGGDEDGAMFALRYAEGVRFGYARGALDTAFELSSIFATSTDSTTLTTNPKNSFFPSMMGYPDSATGTARYMKVGCVP